MSTETEKKRVLIVTQELKPYLSKSSIAEVIKKLPQHIIEKGMEIRVLMPRFGFINERRHRLHEVVRLSGINITVGADDYPLMIKVASYPGVRLQVYFLDNEDLFKRKGIFQDEREQFFPDNAERMIFFCKGVLETVKKFGWPPHIIHCHGWMTSLIPYYLQANYKSDPVFSDTKVIYSVYENTFQEKLQFELNDKAAQNGMKDAVEFFHQANNQGLHLGGALLSDGVILASDCVDSNFVETVQKHSVKMLSYQGEDQFLQACHEFYQTILAD